MKGLYQSWLFYLMILCLLTNVWGQPKSLVSKEPYILTHKDGDLDIQKLDILNSKFEERSLSLTENGNLMFFQTQRGGQLWSSNYINELGDSTHDGDIWFSRRVNGSWQVPTPLPYGFNTSSNEDEPMAFNQGKTLYFQSWNSLWEATDGPYYRKKRRGKRWKRANGLGSGITEFFRDFVITDGMTISPDEKTFIVAAGEANQTNLDIYWSRKGAFGWSMPERLPISTARDERTLYLASDGKTLYFSSDGYGGFGGLDIFKTTLNDDGTFGEIINLGQPINTKKNDSGFVISSDGQEGFFIRDGDIYSVNLSNSDPSLKPLN